LLPFTIARRAAPGSSSRLDPSGAHAASMSAAPLKPAARRKLAPVAGALFGSVHVMILWRVGRAPSAGAPGGVGSRTPSGAGSLVFAARRGPLGPARGGGTSGGQGVTACGSCGAGRGAAAARDEGDGGEAGRHQHVRRRLGDDAHVTLSNCTAKSGAPGSMRTDVRFVNWSENMYVVSAVAPSDTLKHLRDRHRPHAHAGEHHRHHAGRRPAAMRKIGARSIERNENTPPTVGVKSTAKPQVVETARATPCS
jgi:hypothetical protein